MVCPMTLWCERGCPITLYSFYDIVHMVWLWAILHSCGYSMFPGHSLYTHKLSLIPPILFNIACTTWKIMQGAWGWGYNIVYQHSCSLNVSSVFSNVQLFWLLYTKICVDPYPKRDFTKNCVTIIVFFVMSPSPRRFWMFKSLNTGFCIWCVLCESMIYFHWYS